MIQLTKRELNKLSTVKKRVEKLNADLQKYFDASGDMSLPDIGCTLIGYSSIELAETNDILNKEGNITGEEVIIDGIKYRVEYVEEDGEIFFSGQEDLQEEIRYQRRRLNKAWKVFMAENPDAELEKEDEEDL